MPRNPSAILFDQLIRLIMWIVILSTFRARQMWRDLRLCDARVYRPARKVQEILSAKSYLKQFFREQILSILSAFIFVRNPLGSNHYPCVEMIYEYVTTLTKLSLRSLAPGCKRHSISSSPNSSCPNFPNANDARYTILLSFYTSKFFATQTTWLFWSFPWKKRWIETSCVESPGIDNQLANITTKASANYTFRPRKPTSNRYPNLENQETHNMCSMSTACPCVSCWKSLDAVRGNGNSQLASSGGRWSFQCLEPSNCNMKTCGGSVSKRKIKLWQLDNHRNMMV